jgi:hypothetical protein
MVAPGLLQSGRYDEIQRLTQEAVRTAIEVRP